MRFGVWNFGVLLHTTNLVQLAVARKDVLLLLELLLLLLHHQQQTPPLRIALQ